MKQTIEMERMSPAGGERSLLELDITADSGVSKGTPLDDWHLQIYVRENGQLVVSARWVDALKDRHEVPAVQQGNLNVARWNVPYQERRLNE